MASSIRLNFEPDVAEDSEEPDAVEFDTADTETADTGTAEQVREHPRSRWVGPAGTLLLVLVAIVSTVIAVLASLSWRSAADDDTRNRDVLAVASTMAVNLVTLGQQSADADLARVIDGTTGDFKEQFVSASDGFGAMLTEGGVESVGEVKSAGIVDATDDTATVLAAVTSTVKNNEAPDGEVRVYRMKLTLDHVDGRWLVSNVEFVA